MSSVAQAEAISVRDFAYSEGALTLGQATAVLSRLRQIRQKVAARTEDCARETEDEQQGTAATLQNEEMTLQSPILPAHLKNNATSPSLQEPAAAKTLASPCMLYCSPGKARSPESNATADMRVTKELTGAPGVNSLLQSSLPSTRTDQIDRSKGRKLAYVLIPVAKCSATGIAKSAERLGGETRGDIDATIKGARQTHIDITDVNEVPQAAKRPRGRPRKRPLEIKDHGTSTNDPEAVKRPRGRPRKTTLENQDHSTSRGGLESKKHGRYQPRKPGTATG